MKIPASFYGPSTVIIDRAREMAQRIRAGGTLDEAVGAERLDTATTDGLIVLTTDTALIDPAPHFFVTLAWTTVWSEAVGKLIIKGQRAEAKALEAPLFDESIASDWGTLGAMRAVIPELINPRSRVTTLVEAAAKWWNSFLEVGARYSMADPEGSPFTHVVNGLPFLLSAFDDIPEEYSRLPTPAAGPAPLLDRIRAQKPK